MFTSCAWIKKLLTSFDNKCTSYVSLILVADPASMACDHWTLCSLVRGGASRPSNISFPLEIRRHSNSLRELLRLLLRVWRPTNSKQTANESSPSTIGTLIKASMTGATAIASVSTNFSPSKTTYPIPPSDNAIETSIPGYRITSIR